jgi:hypothetical protein
MDGFDHVLNWKLKEGSHPFPGKDSGTCINEAAIVAAGFKYRPVYSAEAMPDCFSRPICKLAMQLNDSATDAERQRLLPYVTRLACADTPYVEAKRAAFIMSQNVTDGLLVRARPESARRSLSHRAASGHARAGRGENADGGGSGACVQRHV